MKVKAFFSKLWLKTKAVSKKAWTLAKLHKAVSIAAAATVVVGTTTAIVLPIVLHKHEYASAWKFDADSHWHEATCKHGEEKGDLASHTYDNACDADCNVCGSTREPSAHVYANKCDTSCDECGATRNVGQHVYSNNCDASCNECGKNREPSSHVYDDETCDADCNVCGATRAVSHVYTNACDADCNECSATRDVGQHVYTNNCDTDCNECGETRTTDEHEYDNACDTSCNECGAIRTVGDHVYDNNCDTACNECGSTRAITHDYSVALTEGADTHWYACTVCGDKKDEVAHTFDQKNTGSRYLKTAAVPGVSLPVYYKSCVCGQKGGENDVFQPDKSVSTISNIVISGKVYDGTPVNAPSYTAVTNGAVSVQYKLENADDSTYTYTRPKDVGRYIVRISVSETATFTSAVEYANFEITRQDANITAIDIAATVTYTGNPVFINGFTATIKDGATIKYFDEQGNEVAAPTNAGKYTVRVTVPATDNWDGDEMTKEFEIVKAKVDLTLTAEDIIYGASLNITATTSVEYTLQYSSDGGNTYSTNAPENAGNYLVRIIPNNASYEFNGETVKSFKIKKATVNVYITSNGNITYGNKYTITKDNNSAEIKILYSADNGESYSTEEPKNAGSYLVKVSLVDSHNYEFEGGEAVKVINLTINKVSVTVDIVFTGVVGGVVSYGTNFEVSANITSGDYSGQKIIKYIAENGTEYDTNAKNMPVGKYTVSVSLQNSNYEITSGATKEFEIKKAVVGISITSDGNITYGDDYTITKTNDNAEIEIFYSADNGETYSAEKPTNAGEYLVKISLVDSVNYEFEDKSAVKVMDLTINPFAITDLELKVDYNATTSFSADLADIDEKLGITVTVDNKNVGVKNVLTATLTGDNASNYSIEISEITLTVEAAELIIEWTDPKDLAYDNTAKVATAEISGGVLLSDVVSIESITLNGDNKSKGSTFTFTVVLGGSDAGNYVMDKDSSTYTIAPCKHKTADAEGYCTIPSVDKYGFCTIPDCGDYSGTTSKEFNDGISVTAKPGETIYCRIGPAPQIKDSLSATEYILQIESGFDYEDIYAAYEGTKTSADESKMITWEELRDLSFEFEAGTYIYFVIEIPESEASDVYVGFSFVPW